MHFIRICRITADSQHCDKEQYFIRYYSSGLQPCSWRATILQTSVQTLLQHTCL